MQFVTLGCEMAMVFGGVVPYIPQYIQIKQKQTTQVRVHTHSSTRYVVRIGKNSCTGFPAKYNFLISVAVRVTNDIIFFILISYILRMANEQRISFFCRNSLFQCLNRYRYYNVVTARVTGFYDISKVFLK